MVRHPSAVLLVGQLLAVLAYPFLDGNAVGRAVLGVVGMVLVLIAIWVVRATPVLRWVAVLLGAPAMVLTVMEALSPDTDWIVITSAAWHAPFYFYVSYAMIQYLFHDDRVTRDELFATGAAFTVVAWGFAYVFSGVHALQDSTAFTSPGEVGWFELLFLSFANLTSVGLSDVLPVTEHARSVVMVEQVVGVLYVALVVARLVGLTVARAAGRDSES